MGFQFGVATVGSSVFQRLEDGVVAKLHGGVPKTVRYSTTGGIYSRKVKLRHEGVTLALRRRLNKPARWRRSTSTEALRCLPYFRTRNSSGDFHD